jgi:CRISPR system Cascade subunit CasE
MYLSKLQLDPRSRTARQWLHDCYAVHRGMMAAFPDADTKEARAALGVLFRVDVRRDGPAAVLVQSRAKPDWSRLPAGTVTIVDGPKHVAPAYDGLQAGQQLRFRLRANPTRRVSKWAAKPDSDRGEQEANVGKRVEIRHEADRIAWLERRGRAFDGFELIRVRAHPGHSDDTVAATRVDPGAPLISRPRRLTLGAALFEGVLRITDAERFRHAVAEGIGPGKAFGCGLLSVAPALGAEP